MENLYGVDSTLKLMAIPSVLYITLCLLERCLFIFFTLHVRHWKLSIIKAERRYIAFAKRVTEGE